MSNYVILTGSKNNAGDYLIKYRAKQIFFKERPDRQIIDINGWEKFNDETLSKVNSSKALILMGGPALQKNMWPNIYGLRDNLDEIKVPILMMGVGWYSSQGNWENTYNYPLDNNTKKLLERIKNSGYKSSVRDYHTMNSLWFHGVDNILMTGCPAYYDYDCLEKKIELPEIKKVGFSLGVSFINSSNMEKLMKDNILRCKKYFDKQDFKVVFHHSLNQEVYLNSHNANGKYLKRHNEFAKWLTENNIDYIDISGSAENLINYYSSVDLHIGYRVHAHIFMNSISKFSILLSEDGRAKATQRVIGGVVLDGVNRFKEHLFDKIGGRLHIVDRYDSNIYLSDEIIHNIQYEEETNYKRLEASRKNIDTNYSVMKTFINQLP